MIGRAWWMWCLLLLMFAAAWMFHSLPVLIFSILVFGYSLFASLGPASGLDRQAEDEVVKFEPRLNPMLLMISCRECGRWDMRYGRWVIRPGVSPELTGKDRVLGPGYSCACGTKWSGMHLPADISSID